MTLERQVNQCKCAICEAGSDPEIVQHHHRMNLFLSRLNEPQRRWYVGLLSQKPASPSDRELVKVTGLDEKTIRRGRQELAGELADQPMNRQRREGGGRTLSEKNPTLESALLEIVSPHTAGDPMGKGKWLNCRLRDIQRRLHKRGHELSLPVIGRLLRKHDYRLRANAKQLASEQHPERDQQFQHLYEQRALHQAAGQPIMWDNPRTHRLLPWIISRTGVKQNCLCCSQAPPT